MLPSSIEFKLRIRMPGNLSSKFLNFFEIILLLNQTTKINFGFSNYNLKKNLNLKPNIQTQHKQIGFATLDGL
jgi:hypothetical protein